jgi:hypothetical protein
MNRGVMESFPLLPWIDGSNYADKDRLLRFQVFPYDLQNLRTVLLTGKRKIENFVSGAVLSTVSKSWSAAELAKLGNVLTSNFLP